MTGVARSLHDWSDMLQMERSPVPSPDLTQSLAHSEHTVHKHHLNKGSSRETPFLSLFFAEIMGAGDKAQYRNGAEMGEAKKKKERMTSATPSLKDKQRS